MDRNEMDELLLHVQAAHLRAQFSDAGSGEHRLDLIQAVACKACSLWLATIGISCAASG